MNEFPYSITVYCEQTMRVYRARTSAEADDLAMLFVNSGDCTATIRFFGGGKSTTVAEIKRG